MASKQKSLEEFDERAKQGETVVQGGTGGKSLEAQEHLAEGRSSCDMKVTRRYEAEEERRGRSSWGTRAIRRWDVKEDLVRWINLVESVRRKKELRSKSPSSPTSDSS